MLSRLLTGLGVAGFVVMIGVPATALADPEAAPGPPNVDAFAPVKPSEYSVNDGAWYAFSAPSGLTCVLDRQTGGYGCSGPIPAAPGGANLVSAGPVGGPGFANSARPLYGVSEGAKPLPPNTRLSFRTVSCGTDGVATMCTNSIDRTGFVLSPTGSFVFGA
ncbi:hypothetical protein BST36_00825 [Mycolicibacterium moriokaense]|uniref:Secreted protein n=1 Tax=Mycolicibacterium moriokaense TaxID=39691 RepID=A0AAD1HB48_9MYCO|nr:hypothetical protein [Mycolicibacterium moriokaense]MCV7041136.1 hypothetical protein [Mycolicibacterium moriokaense]ORB27256.1 hypothetical protein BST36_00825 [Mycolicibacterium moriokaense]BBX00698.1 hypothetical protein MMOR_16340 [Mycolicibacterium moriokaense]